MEYLAAKIAETKNPETALCAAALQKKRGAINRASRKLKLKSIPRYFIVGVYR